MQTAYAHSGLGLAYAGLGNYELALSEFQKSITLEPENAWVYFNRAVSYELMGKQDEALSDYATSLKKQHPPLNPHKRERAEAKRKTLRA